MRKFLILSAGSVFLFSGTLFAQEAVSGDAPEGDQYQQIAREAERNKELLEIWKDHVRTLTEERNAAYKELETFKSAVPQQFGMETQAIPAGMMTQAAGQNLTSQMATLQGQNERIQRELNEAQSDKNLLIKEKEEALSRLESLKQNSEAPQTISAPVQPSQSYRNLMNNYELQKRKLSEALSRIKELENAKPAPAAPIEISDNPDTNELISQKEDALRQLREVSYQNETLKAKADKLTVIEKELNETRAYLTPMIQELENKNKDLEEKIKNLEEENRHLSGEKALLEDSAEKTQAALASKASIERENAEFRSKTGELNSKIEKLSISEAELATLTQKYAALQRLYSAADSQARKKQADIQGLTKNIQDLQQTNQSLTDDKDALKASSEEAVRQIAQLGSSVQALTAEAEKAKALQAQQIKAIETLKLSLKNNFSDIQNLKSNLESYLESLVTNFQERQQKEE